MTYTRRFEGVFDPPPYLPISSISTLWYTYKKLWKLAIEIVSFPIKHGDFPVRYVELPEG